MDGDGPDISEHQTTFPGGPHDFVIIRVLNEYGREDFRWRQHRDEARARGIPAGAYAIVEPGRIDATEYGRRLVAILASERWELIPTVDVELGDPAANRPYCRQVAHMLRIAGHPIVMGYYSARSAYRSATGDLFDRQWLASWGAPLPPDADLHQYTNRPVDMNYAPDLDRLRVGVVPPPPPVPTEGTEDVWVCSTEDNPDQCYVFIGGRSSTCSPDFKMQAHEQGVMTLNDVHPLQVIRWRLDFPPAAGYNPGELAELSGGVELVAVPVVEVGE